MVVGWGAKPNTKKARDYAAQKGLPFCALEDGFLRSFGSGRDFPPLSLVVDDVGIYYDSTRPSSLENLLNTGGDILSDVEATVQDARQTLLKQGLSKYNNAPPLNLSALRPHDSKRVLVVDQTAGDMSVELGGANADTFICMLRTALTENPDATVYIKTHPDVSSGQKRGYLADVQADERVVVLRAPVNPLSLLNQMDRVYVVSSTMGFEALLAGKAVTCFGLPWYAGWGVTDDRQRRQRRTRTRTVDELFAAAYVHYSRYLDPATLQRGRLEDVIGWLSHQKTMADTMHGVQRQGRVIAVQLRRWKAANLKPFLGLEKRLVFSAPTVAAAKALAPTPEDTLVIWGASPPTGLQQLANASGARLLHIEDGFVRSVGLGSDLIRPLSLVLDRRGIYFDATRESDLEHMLGTSHFSREDLDRARKVREFVVAHGITKYNLEPRQTVHWPSGGKEVILVPGQVEDDASIRLGCTTIRTNLELLRAVRASRPDAFIVYKPHPDVLSGNRRGSVALEEARRWADHIEVGVSVISCIEACDEVHTMTSLTGFDALIRGKRVVTYGQPFYAGWGLTDDRAIRAVAFERRRRRLSLDELVAGTLLLYPIYWDWDLKGYTTCEAVLYRIAEQISKPQKTINRPWIKSLRRQITKLLLTVKK